MAIKNEIVDELLKDVDPKKVFSSEGLLSDIKKALAERMLNAELDDHLQNEAAAGGTGNEPAAPNHRNGYTKKTVITDTSLRGGLNTVELAQMSLDVAHAHAAGVHGNDLVIETREAPLILGNQTRWSWRFRAIAAVRSSRS